MVGDGLVMIVAIILAGLAVIVGSGLAISKI